VSGLRPIVATPEWTRTVEAAGWQCQCAGVGGHKHTIETGNRCPHRGDGPAPYRLYVVPTKPAGLTALCAKCADAHDKATPAAPPAPAVDMEPLF